MSELTLDKNYKKGDKGKEVKKIQEWLCYHGYGLYIDSDFGPATELCGEVISKSSIF